MTGTIGKHKLYLWSLGAIVNIAKRIESIIKSGKIYIIEYLHKLIEEDFFFLKEKMYKRKGC